LVALLVGAIWLDSAAEGPPGYGPRRTQMEAEYAHGALDAYGRGYAQIESAHRLELDAAAATDERTGFDARSQAAEKFEEALRSFTDAVRVEPRFYEAWTYIGYANRKLRRYDPALAAYEEALRIKPDYAQAIQYQGEAFLALNRFEPARLNYLRLYVLDDAQARKLLDAMSAWAVERTKNRADFPAEQLTAALEWIDARRARQPAVVDPAGW
jgi:tetratricopeptide (TPR) repeat protein